MAIVEIRGDESVLTFALNDGRQISRTAQKIYDMTVNEPLNQFDVIIDATMNNGCLAFHGFAPPQVLAIYKKHFNTTEIKRPTVIWNPRYELECLCDVAGVSFPKSLLPQRKSKMDASLLDGDILYKYDRFIRPTIRATKWHLPAWVVLYHELGHAVQYFEAVASKNADQRRVALEAKFSTTQTMEADNLLRHENKICVEAGIPVRHYYLSSVEAFNSYFIDRIPHDEKNIAVFIADNPAARVEKDRKLKDEIKKGSTVYSFPLPVKRT